MTEIHKVSSMPARGVLSVNQTRGATTDVLILSRIHSRPGFDILDGYFCDGPT